MSEQGRPGIGKARTAEFIGSWRAALRIARREARRARGRTALVLSMIILPVLALTFVAVSVDMSRLTADERLDRQLAAADAELRSVSRASPITQSGNGDHWNVTVENDDETTEVPRPRSTQEIAALLPEGSHVLPVVRWLPITTWDDDQDRMHELTASVVDLTDPLGRGLAHIHAGRAPVGADEIAVNPAARRKLGVALGDQVNASNGRKSWTVVGVIEAPDQLSPAAILHPAGVPAGAMEIDSVFLVDLPGPLTTELFRHLNDHGVVVTTRTPAPPTEYDAAWRGGIGAREEVSLGVLIGGLGLLEVVLLVGPAFAVGVRRRRRELALVAVAGGDAAHLRRVVLADGVVLGTVGALIGIALGIGLAVAGRPLMEEFVFQHRFGGYRFWPTALVVIGLVAVLAGVLAALTPAWMAARQDVVAGLANRRTPPVHSRRWLVVGLLLAAGGAAVAALGAVVSSDSVTLAGLLVGELGLVFATPTLVGLVSRAGRFLPLVPRMALRDASRNRSSAAPAISAVMAAVAGSVAVGLLLVSEQARDEERFRPSLPDRSVLVWVEGAPGEHAPPTLAEITEPAREHLKARNIAPLMSTDCLLESDCLVTATLPPERACPWRSDQTLSEAEQLRARADTRCQGRPDDYFGLTFRVVVDDGSALPILTGAGPDQVAAATAVLRAGGAVLTDPRYVVDGRVELQVLRHLDEDRQEKVRTLEVPGHALHHDLDSKWLLLSQAAADRLGLVTRHTGWAIDSDSVADQEQQIRFNTAIRSLGPLGVQISDSHYRGGTLGGLLLLAGVSAVVTVGATASATGLAAAEGRADLSTLAAVGASPGVRRLLSLCQAGVIAVLGSALGIVAGLGAAMIILLSTNQRYVDTWPIEPPYPVIVPWITLGVLIAVPLVAMVGAALFTRSRLPVERRMD
ncbi:ABC transporter permease [Verrucosispora sp. ts21]|uniref:ABC transporter permease n=1 Tax=Verrucosispora sp. ts21 TaxID=2069341 RepID=UPI001E4E1BA9|nr:ABC transporter permease [Verrucosispora sp. ts21]